ncbi:MULTISPECIES: acyl-CoA thioesterase [Bacillaceae]|uniref:Acyl-CoA thioesterase n=1 Tax=Evansella alkalicola TaxID=745819 RepID=A0ABS6JRK8_9BACI|nr:MULTISPECIES: thioesterase family protein [Bacillaceae]MBU9721206.1 acyl-CoA thioesterase [Bacillus alkalicola]
MAIPDYIEDMEQWVKGFKYKCPITVRFSETDAFGHLNNTKTFVYFEQARINFFKDCGLSDEWFTSNGSSIPVVADLHCDYLRQVFFDEELQVGVKVAHVGTSSVDIHYMITNSKEEICHTGRGRIVQIDREKKKPIPWSDKVKENLLKTI